MLSTIDHLSTGRLTSDFQGRVSFTHEELKGVPEDVVSGYTKQDKDGKELYDVTFKTPDIFPLVRFYRILRAPTANSATFNPQV